MLKDLKIVLIFYKRILLWNWIFNLSLLYLIFNVGFAPVYLYVFWTFVIRNLSTILYINSINPESFYFYYNFGFSKTGIYTKTFLLDLLLFTAVLIVILQFHSI
jgi:hypothetical protein